MSQTRSSAIAFENVAKLLKRLGGIPPQRVRMHPAPGQATEKDVITVHDRENRLCELVDGTLVEKVMGFTESLLAAGLLRMLGNYVTEKDLGVVAGADGTIKLLKGLVRIPDVAFFSWERLPGRQLPRRRIPPLVPDLAVEVLSWGNTPKEMERKLKEYFLAGVRLVWFVDPNEQTVEVFTAPDRSTILAETQILTGGEVLPGLQLSVRSLFTHLPRPGREQRSRQRKRRVKDDG
jgi:Uma2 family endonuclease